MSTRREQLLAKFAREGYLSGDDDYALCQEFDKPSNRSVLSKSQVPKEGVEKVKRESALRAARELNDYLRKSATVATPPPRDEIIITKSTNIPWVVGTALAKSAQNVPVDLNPLNAKNPAGSESDNPTIPGGARGFHDLGGNPSDDELARAGDNAAQVVRLIAAAMKPAVLAVRY